MFPRRRRDSICCWARSTTIWVPIGRVVPCFGEPLPAVVRSVVFAVVVAGAQTRCTGTGTGTCYLSRAATARLPAEACNCSTRVAAEETPVVAGLAPPGECRRADCRDPAR